MIHVFGPDEHGKLPISIIQRPLHTAEYYVLSYTWGGEKPSISITCNGKQLLITSNLHHALRTLSNQGYHDLWADAICIDQSNKEEEAIQEPLIGTVYSEAHEVLIWLGPAGPHSDLAMDGIAGCLQELIADAEDVAGRIVLQDELEDPGLPDVTIRCGTDSLTFTVDHGHRACGLRKNSCSRRGPLSSVARKR